MIESLGYSYDIANTTQELLDITDAQQYKIVLFDKECEDLSVKEFSAKIKNLNQESELTTSLILVSDTSSSLDEDDTTDVDETIQNVINKDLLRLVFEKFI